MQTIDASPTRQAPRTGAYFAGHRAALADRDRARSPLTGPLDLPPVERAVVRPDDEAFFWELVHARGASWLGVAPPRPAGPAEPVNAVPTRTRVGTVTVRMVQPAATSGRPWNPTRGPATPPPVPRTVRSRVGILRSLATAACLVIALAVAR